MFVYVFLLSLRALEKLLLCHQDFCAGFLDSEARSLVYTHSVDNFGAKELHVL